MLGCNNHTNTAPSLEARRRDSGNSSDQKQSDKLPGRMNYDFGRILLNDARKTIRHCYEFKNNQDDFMKMIEFKNEKPCCGSVKPIPTPILQPGNSIELCVELKTQQGYGQVYHKATLFYEYKNQMNTIELYTKAEYLPRYRIERLDDNYISLECGRSAEAVFKAIQHTQIGEGTPKLKAAQIRCSGEVKADWMDDYQEKTIDNKYLQNTRSFKVVTNPQNDPGDKAASISLVIDGRTEVSDSLKWIVSESLVATPRFFRISMESIDSSKNLICLVKSVDKRAFNIISIKPTCKEVQTSYDRAKPASVHTIKIGASRPVEADEKGASFCILHIVTDHPNGHKISVPIYFIK